MRTSLLALPLIFSLSIACDGGEEGDSGHDMDMGDDSDMGDMNLSTTATSDGGSFQIVRSEPTISVSDPFDLVFTVSSTDDPGTPLTDATLAFAATMPSHGHGMNVDPTETDNGDGTTTVSGVVFHMAGHWEAVVEVTQGETTESAVFDFMLE